MSDNVQNSALPPRNFPKSRLMIDGPSYMGLDLEGLDVGDEVTYVIHGVVKQKAQSQMERDGRSIQLLVNTIQDQTPRNDRDLTNRLQ